MPLLLENTILHGFPVPFNTAADGEYPWFVSLEIGNGSGQFYCGASLISATKVLSAAHCFVDNDGNIFLPDQVRIGHTTTTNGETVGVECVSIHPDYIIDFVGLYSDIAVLTLSASATTTDFVTLNSDVGYPSSSGQELTAIGFGRTSNGGPISDVLKKAPEAFVTIDNCRNDWQCVDTDYHVCAAQGTNVGVCQGK